MHKRSSASDIQCKKEKKLKKKREGEPHGLKFKYSSHTLRHSLF